MYSDHVLLNWVVPSFEAFINVNYKIVPAILESLVVTKPRIVDIILLCVFE